ncbi:hypothetical protein PVAP13_5NG557466 [Panicum virgatum]|uniref:Uncharacterized protein n=1 Tax=Panicum virgatum TaxID=38727 RepID=A0A8T0S1K0_PANVG|nr:hypothetical protein PVAP13_5NG557466 [Panicum virgatum]
MPTAPSTRHESTTAATSDSEAPSRGPDAPLPAAIGSPSPRQRTKRPATELPAGAGRPSAPIRGARGRSWMTDDVTTKGTPARRSSDPHSLIDEWLHGKSPYFISIPIPFPNRRFNY